MSGCSVTHSLRHEGEEEQLHFPEESEEEMKEMDDEEKGKGDEREGGMRMKEKMEEWMMMRRRSRGW